MKEISLYILLFVVITSYSQEAAYNIQDGYIAGGYDVVTYFENNPIVGDNKFVFKYDNVSFKFSSERTLNLFKHAPQKYMPQYGGWCAYAIALKNKRVTVNPNTYEIRDGKLYLFYNTRLINTHKKWLSKKPEVLILKANDNWSTILMN